MFDTDGGAIQPCKCFICEHSFEPGEHAISTGWNYEPDYPSRLYGAKLICDNCVAALAEHSGYVSQTDHAEKVLAVSGELMKVTAERDALQAKVDEGVAGLVKLLDSRRAEAKPRAPRKPVSGGAMTLGH